MVPKMNDTNYGKKERDTDSGKQGSTTLRCVYIDMNGALIRWEDEPNDAPSNTKEVFCGVDHNGGELIKYASIEESCLKLMDLLRKIKTKKTEEQKYNVMLISSSPKIYTNAINNCFNLGFSVKEIISAEEFYEDSNPYQIVTNPYPFKENSKDILISFEPKDSSKSIAKRAYLGIDISRQLTPIEMSSLLEKKMFKKAKRNAEMVPIG